MLYLCDNQALLKVVKRWVGEGGKATFVGALDADSLLEAIEELQQRTTAGAATFLVNDDACFYYYKSSLVPLIEGLCSNLGNRI